MLVIKLSFSEKGFCVFKENVLYKQGRFIHTRNARNTFLRQKIISLKFLDLTTRRTVNIRVIKAEAFQSSISSTERTVNVNYIFEQISKLQYWLWIQLCCTALTILSYSKKEVETLMINLQSWREPTLYRFSHFSKYWRPLTWSQFMFVTFQIKYSHWVEYNRISSQITVNSPNCININFLSQ